MKIRSFRPFALAFLVTVIALASLPAHADGEPGGNADPIAHLLYPPEAMLGHAQELGLDDAQRKAIRTEVVQAQRQFLDAQLNMQEASEGLQRLLQERPVNESKSLAAADQVMGLERTIKRAQLTLLIHLKNLLTPAQLTKMAEIQKRSAS
ncbi:MAG TPA: periplasmic heavy metal sensor [Thermoanaerobaculia bacterium]|nr:periplasmic heavy metal sensor [Thermoanaerobaculia bacterium]